MTTEATQTAKPARSFDPNERAIESQAHDTPEAPANAEAAVAAAASGADAGDEPARPFAGVNRAEIGRKFAKRRQESDEDIPFEGSFAPDHTRAGRLTQVVQDEPAAEPDAGDQHQDDAAAQPRKKLKVLGQEREVDDEEVIRLAQIGAAGTQFLEDAKTKLREAEERLRAVSTLQPGATPPANGQTEHTGATTDPQNPEDDLSAVVEKLQYGAPEDAAEALRDVIRRAQDPEAARKQIYLHHRELDVGRAKTAYETFTAKPDIAELLKDRRNEVVMQDIYYDEVANDLRKLGVPEDAIPKDRDKLVETHRFHRIHGQKVRDTTALLDASKAAFDEWRGAPKARDPNPDAQPGGKVVVKVDRSERRATIPQQPSRAAAPQQQQTQRAVPTTRKAAVDSILAKRRRNITT